MGDIKDSLGSIFDTLFFSTFSRRVAADIEGLSSNRDLLAVGFVGNTVDFLEVIAVRDDLVTGEEVLMNKRQ